jgi:microtubule-associated protein-like 6
MGHSSHVTKVKFSANDTYVISTGGNDKTVIVWETDFSMDDPQAQASLEEEKVFMNADIDDSDFIESKVDKAKVAKQQQKRE